MSWGSGPPTHLGHILWALSHRAKELPGSWEVEIPEVVQGVRVSAWELGRGHLLQELSFKVSCHGAGFHQGDAGNRDEVGGLVSQTSHSPILPIIIPLSFSRPPISLILFHPFLFSHPFHDPHFLVCPSTASIPTSLSPFPPHCPSACLTRC